MNDLYERLTIRANIRRNAKGRKSVEEGKPDRLADLLDESAARIKDLETINKNIISGSEDSMLLDKLDKLVNESRLDEMNPSLIEGILTVRDNLKQIISEELETKNSLKRNLSRYKITFDEIQIGSYGDSNSITLLKDGIEKMSWRESLRVGDYFSLKNIEGNIDIDINININS